MWSRGSGSQGETADTDYTDHKGVGENSWSDGSGHNLDCPGGLSVYAYIKTHQIVHFTMYSFSASIIAQSSYLIKKNLEERSILKINKIFLCIFSMDHLIPTKYS